jgi:hypothetical protein
MWQRIRLIDEGGRSGAILAPDSLKGFFGS